MFVGAGGKLQGNNPEKQMAPGLCSGSPDFTERRLWHILAFLYLSLVCLGRWGEHYTELDLIS